MSSATPDLPAAVTLNGTTPLESVASQDQLSVPAALEPIDVGIKAGSLFAGPFGLVVVVRHGESLPEVDIPLTKWVECATM